MYRSPARRDTNEIPPAEIVCRAISTDRGSSAAVLFRLFALPFIASIAGSLLSPAVGLGGLVLGTGFSVYSWRKGSGPDSVTVRVENGVVLVGSGGAPFASIPLRDLRNVTLDTKSIQKLQEGSAMNPDLRFINAQAGPEVDVARILFVRAGMPDVALFESHVPHMEATELLGKIRVLLRKHGWLPEDEVPESELSASSG